MHDLFFSHSTHGLRFETEQLDQRLMFGNSFSYILHLIIYSLDVKREGHTGDRSHKSCMNSMLKRLGPTILLVANAAGRHAGAAKI